MTQTIVCEVDPLELAVRIAEVCCRMQRPKDQTAGESLEQIERALPGASEQFIEAAHRAMEYISERLQAQGVKATVETIMRGRTQ